MEHEKAVQVVTDCIFEHECTLNFTLDSTFQDIGSDSLDIVNICLLIEDKIGKQLSSQYIWDVKTIGDLVRVVEKS